MLETTVDRWEKRDAAFCLLALEMPSGTLPTGITKQLLEDYRWCSQKWLDMKVGREREGGGGVGIWRAFEFGRECMSSAC
jgi:hypothetical protein